MKREVSLVFAAVVAAGAIVSAVSSSAEEPKADAPAAASAPAAPAAPAPEAKPAAEAPAAPAAAGAPAASSAPVPDAKPAAEAPAAPAAQTAADKPAAAEAAPASAPAADGAAMTPYERVKATEKGKLKNPYKSTDAEIVEQGKKAYLGASCNGCHGGAGGGGMCPPLINETWVYGGDDDTLFRLITMGTDEYKKEYKASRVGQETVVGPMPGFKDIIKDEDKLWKIITFIRASWNGRAEKKTWE